MGVNARVTYLTDTAGSYRTFITQGFGADWAPMPYERRLPRSEGFQTPLRFR